MTGSNNSQHFDREFDFTRLKHPEFNSMQKYNAFGRIYFYFYSIFLA